MKYKVIHRAFGMPGICLPADMDMGDLMEVSGIGDEWAKFMNSQTGEYIDCAVYAAKAREEIGREIPFTR